MSVLKKRRRRTYLPAADRRAQILDCAKTVFSSRGFAGANVADICQAARIGRGTLYQYFDNKRAVLRALMEDLRRRIERVLRERPQLETIPGAARAPVEIVVRFTEKRLREVLDAVFVDEPTLRLLLREGRGQDGAVDEVLALIDRLILGAIERDARAAQELGVLRPGNPRRIALYILGGVEKMVLDALAADEPVDLDAIVRQAVDLELFGLLQEEVRR